MNDHLAKAALQIENRPIFRLCLPARSVATPIWVASGLAVQEGFRRFQTDSRIAETPRKHSGAS